MRSRHSIAMDPSSARDACDATTTTTGDTEQGYAGGAGSDSSYGEPVSLARNMSWNTVAIGSWSPRIEAAAAPA